MMGKGNFINWLKRKFGADDERRRDELIDQYFEKFQRTPPSLSEQEQFDQKKVYARILSDIGNVRIKAMKRRLTLFSAAALMLICLAGIFLEKKRQRIEQDTQVMVEKRASQGAILKLMLSDGTSVWLNAGSRLRYPKSFAKNKRKVFIEGEAFFDVKAEPRRPFYVQTSNVSTEVLGTSFNVTAYEENKTVAVTVASGKVAVSDINRKKNKRNHTAYLLPNQQATYDRKGQLSVNQQIDAKMVAGWKDGKLMFASAPLADVLVSVERRYRIIIHANPEVLGCKVTVDFTNESKEKIIKVLAGLINGEASYHEGAYHLKGEGCSN